MEEIQKQGGMGLAAMRAGMDRKTARKYVRAGKLPSELRKPHIWRTREDPFEEDWPALMVMLQEAPELEARTLFDHLVGLKPEAHMAGQLRTLQRRIRQWRAQRGPEREVFFPQAHRPGEAMQTDFTHASVLGVTICGEPFEHQLCHSVLPFSNWEWAIVCHSESMAALRRGVQSTLFRLGRVPEFHQTDNSTAATHELRTGKRGFNEDYLAMMAHFDMKPRPGRQRCRDSSALSADAIPACAKRPATSGKVIGPPCSSRATISNENVGTSTRPLIRSSRGISMPRASQ